MKKFHFSLSALLQVRIQQEEIEHKNLLEAHVALQKRLNILDQLNKEVENLTGVIAVTQKVRPDPSMLRSLNDYLESLKRKMLHQHALVFQARASMEIQRQRVIRVMHRRKIIENLRDKKYTEWESHNQQLEKTSIDEFSTLRFKHNSK